MNEWTDRQKKGIINKYKGYLGCKMRIREWWKKEKGLFWGKNDWRRTIREKDIIDGGKNKLGNEWTEGGMDTFRCGRRESDSMRMRKSYCERSKKKMWACRERRERKEGRESVLLRVYCCYCCCQVLPGCRTNIIRIQLVLSLWDSLATFHYSQVPYVLGN